MNYYFNLCNLKIKWDSPFEIQIRDDSKLFLDDTENTRNNSPDIEFIIREREQLDFIPSEAMRIRQRYFLPYSAESRTYYLNFEDKYYAQSRRVLKDNHEVVFLDYKQDFKHRLDYSKNAWDHLGLEDVLIPYHAFVLHCSQVKFENNGVLFFGPSGSGKSTQASLWCEQFGAELINGDRAIIRRMGSGEWNSFGLPFAGSSNVYKNDSAAVKMMIFPQKSDKNRMERLTPAHALAKLMPEVSMHYWDPSFCDPVMEMLEALVQKVPIYQMECTRDKSSAFMAMEKLCELRETDEWK